MEGCPRSLMLKLDLKESHITSFAPALKRYIREFYHEDGETYSQECTQFEQLRTAAIKPTYDNSGCNLLRKYYGQIHVLKTRFPMGEGESASVEFTWTDLYTEDPITISDISYEQTSILFNLGALHSLLGSKEDRVTEEGMKVACTHYQSAAGAFTYIKDNFTTDQYSDTSKDVLNLYVNVMLGQAQECLLEKSMLDNRKNSLVARIAMQVQNYYTEAIACLTSSFGEILPPRMHKHWSKTLQIKCAYLNALAYMYMSNTSDEQGKYGEKVALLKIAAQRIADAQKLLKNQSQQMQDVVQFIADAVTQKLDGAKRDNDFIYHEPEPASTALPDIKGASLVKPIPFQPHDPSMGKDIFEKLIPMKAHESSSLYSEEKANLLRRYSSIVSEKDKELSSWLASMHIDDLLRPEEADNLPADLITKCESLQSNPGAIKKSMEMITKLKEKGAELEKTLEETRKEITDVQNEKKTFMEKYNVKLEEDKLKEYLDEVNSYQQKHVDAQKTNDELEKAFQAHHENLELMIGPEQALHGILPSQNILDSPIEDDAVQRIRDLLAKIEKMKTQRVQFMDKLREQVNKDDITHLIATREGEDLESLFKEELKKHDESCELLQCNLDAQEKIMKALTDANAKYAHARRSVAEIKAKRDIVVKSLIGSYDFFMSFKDKVSAGVTFYNQLSEIFEKRRQEITKICKGEKERLQKIVEKAKQIKEERERKSESGASSSVAMPPERKNNPGNPQQPSPVGYQAQQGHVSHGLPSHHSIPHSLRGPVPRQPPLIQSGLPNQFNPPPTNPPPRGLINQPGMSQYIPRVPSATLLTARPRMSYPHPPFPSVSQPGSRPATSMSWQPPPGSNPGDISPTASGNIRFPPPQGIRPPNVSQGQPVPPQQYPGRPQLPMHTVQGQTAQHGQGGEDRSNWQPQQYGQGPQYRVGAPDQNLSSHMIPQRHMVPRQTIMSNQPRPAGQPPLQQRPALQQRPPSQILPAVQQHQLPQLQQPQNISQQPSRPETPPSPQRIQQTYQPQPPSYEQQFGIGSNQSLQQPQHMQPPSPRQPAPYQNPAAAHTLQSHGQHPHGLLQHSQQPYSQRPSLYQQHGGQPMSNQPSRTHQLQTPYQQQPQMQPSNPRQPLPHQVPSGHHQVASKQQQPQSTPQARHQPQTQHLPLQQQQGPPPKQVQQQSGQYHQLGPYQQRFPYQQPSGPHQYVPQQSQQQGLQGPNQQPVQYIPPVQNQPPTPYHQLPPSQVPPNLPPALEPQSYQKQPLMAKLSSENLAPKIQQQGSYHSPQNVSQEPSGKPLQPLSKENVPYQSSQHEKPASHASQPPYGGTVQPTQTRNKDSMPPQDVHSHVQQPFYNRSSESQYPQAPTKQEQQTSQAGSQNESAFANQQWQQHQQYQQTSKTVPEPNISKPGVYPSASAYFLPTSSNNMSHTHQETGSSRQGDYPPHIPKSAVYSSPNPSSQVGVNVTSSYTQENRPNQQVDHPNIPKPGVYPSSSSQDVPTGPSGSYPTQQVQPSSNTFNPNLSHETNSPYFPRVSGQPSQPSSTESRPTHVSGGSVSSSNLNFRSESLKEFNPTKVVLSKPGALSVSSMPDNPEPTTSKQTLPNDFATSTQCEGQSNVSQGASSYSDVVHFDNSEYHRTGQASRSSTINTASAAHLSIVKPKSTVDDKLLENLKSLDFPLLPKHPENSPDVVTSEPDAPGSGSSDIAIDTAGLHGQGLAAASSQEDVQKLQQKVLLQQQQLIEQQQRFLQQQTLGEHSQVWRLMEQIKQQQRELEELRSEMKVKDQFGEIERHLENLERKQNLAETKKDEGVQSGELLGKTSEESREGDKQVHDESMKSEGKLSHPNKEAKALEMGEKPLFEKTTRGEGSEITTEVSSGPSVNNKPQEIKEDFLMNQLSQFSLSSSQHDSTIVGSIEKPASKPASEQNTELKNDSVSDEPPPKPSKTPQANIRIEAIDQPKIDTSVLNQESKMTSHTGVFDSTTKNNEGPPTKPIKHRPPPPPPGDHSLSEPEVARDAFTKPSLDRNVVDANKPDEKNDEDDYLSKLPSLVENYRDIVNDLTKRQARGPSILTKEWLAVQRYQDTVSQVLTCDVAKNNATKNRYLDILPYDQTRVILQGKEDSDYINATMVEDLTPLSPKYIASQGPIPQCFMDFWLMVWQQKCPLIVMLTKEVEGKKLKCHQYWPKDEGHSMLFGSLRVTMKRQKSLPFWKERLIHITHNETHEVHVVEHYQFTGWPDHGVPSSPSDFFNFMGHIYIRHQSIDPEIKKPILLHCSAGVGRTGAFIVIYSAMREMYSGNGIMDVQKLVKKLREKRKYMVQKKEQYEFCYKGILYSAEQFLIIENSGNNVEDDSSDYSSSSDDIYEKSSDEYEEPVVPQRPPISKKPKEISQNSNDGKKDDSGNSAQASQQQSTLNSGNADSFSQKCDVVSEKSDCTFTKSDQSVVKVPNVEENSKNNEPGNTLNNFLEICTKRLPDIDDLPLEINDEVIVPGGFQNTNVKSSMAESPSKESSSVKKSDMGDTKYKEITEEPEEQIAKSGNSGCEKTDCSTPGSKNAADIPGLQEIQEGLIKDADDVTNDQTGDAEFKDVSVKYEANVQENVEQSPVEDVEILRPEETGSHDPTNSQDGSAECADTPTKISVGKESKSLPSETGNSSPEDLLQKETEGKNKELKQELTSMITENSAETENQLNKK